MKFVVTHITRYRYQQPVSMCYNRSHIIPRRTESQLPENSIITLEPMASSANRRTDYFGNTSFHFAIDTPHTELSLSVSTRITMNNWRGQPSLSLAESISCNQAYMQLHTPSTHINDLMAREFVLDSPMIHSSSVLREYAQPLFTDQQDFLTAVANLNTAIYNDFDYVSGATHVATPIADVMVERQGVCQDFAHIAIGCLRSLGYAARYVSGYLETVPPPGEKKLVGADATHAWFAVYCPGQGWFEFDPTNNSIPGEQHIVTAWGRDYSDVSPLRGVIFGGSGQQQLDVSVDVARVN